MIRVLRGVRHTHSSVTTQLVSELSLPVPWGDIRGKAWGPSHGRPVLCLHGWSDNCGTFNNLIPLLPKECRYVAVDLPGHALQWDRFSIIGHSMGGNIAGMFSVLYPEMVDSVVLLDSCGFFPVDEKDIPRIMKQGFDEMLQFEKQGKEKTKVYTYEKSAERLLAAIPSLSERSVRILLERGLSQVEGGVVYSRDFRINLKSPKGITLEQSLVLLAKMQAPVLVILADDGFAKLFPHQAKAKSALLQAYLDRNDTVLTVPGDHHIHLNNAEVVAPLVSDFLHAKVLNGPNERTSKL